MTRRVRGELVTIPSADGTTWALRIPYKGQRFYVPLGSSWNGWTRERVEDERDTIATLIAREAWTPPEKPIRKKKAQPPTPVVTFQLFASDVLARKKSRVGEKAYLDLKWRLTVAIRHLGPLPIEQVDTAAIEDMVTALLEDRAAIDAARTQGVPLTSRRVNPRTGREFEQARRGLSRRSINRVVTVVRMVLADAERRGLVPSNPAADPALRIAAPKPSRSYLEVGQVVALQAAAREVEDRNRPLSWGAVQAIRVSDRTASDLAREHGVSDVMIGKIRKGAAHRAPVREPQHHVIVTALVLLGLRVEELCSLNGADMDFAAGRVRVPRAATKTDAGERTIPMLPAVRDVLLRHRADDPYGPDDPVFRNRQGRRQTQGNVRSRILTPAVEQANVSLAAMGAVTIEHCTPHSLRRTFASLLAELGVDPRRAISLMGQTSASFMLSVYQQVLDADSARDNLPELLGCTEEEALRVLSGRSRPTLGNTKLAPSDRIASQEGRAR